jgi:hypothetical protein
MKRIGSYFALAFFFFVLSTNAQTAKYRVCFDKKNTGEYQPEKHLTPEALRNRELLKLPKFQLSDVPVDENYLRAIAAQNAKVVNVSKWLNAAYALMTEEQAENVSKYSFVVSVERIDQKYTFASQNFNRENFGRALEQMNAGIFVKENLNGKGVKVGIIDAGFFQAHESPLLAKIFEEKRVIFYRDFVAPRKQEFFAESETDKDDHGTTVFEMIAGKEKGGIQTGFAHQAEFYLARTDHGDKEFRGEEDYWIRAMEMMDSLGVRLINTSLGYAKGFDKKEENYKPSEMDGKTSKITQAATLAAKEKGMIIIVSAGNEGADKWQIITAPADSPEVLSVAANNANGLRASYSSIGPDFLDYLKPNVSAYSMTGTSFSAPIITGFAACLLQAKPDLTYRELFTLIEKSSQFYPHGNNYLGHGIPDARRAWELLQGKPHKSLLKEVEAKKECKLSVDKNAKSIFIIHKKNRHIVVEQDITGANGGRVVIKRSKSAAQTTVWDGNEGYEIIWK